MHVAFHKFSLIGNIEIWKSVVFRLPDGARPKRKVMKGDVKKSSLTSNEKSWYKGLTGAICLIFEIANVM